jgi:transposase
VWTEIAGEKYRRDELRYASDTRGAEWARLAPLLPAPRRLGRPRQRDLRAIIDAILYLLWTGCRWRALPRDFPPRSCRSPPAASQKLDLAKFILSQNLGMT